MAKVHYWILESETFWGEIIEKEHKREAESLQELKREQNKVIIKWFVITVEMVKIKSRRIPNWKAPERDGAWGCWIKQFSSLRERPAIQLNEIISDANRSDRCSQEGQSS